MSVRRAEAESPVPGRMLPVTRAGIAVLLLLAIANGGFLYFFPAQAEPDYAWAIKPPVSAAFIGAGYLAGMVATALGVFAARSYAAVRALVPAFCVLGITLFAATMIDADRFRWDYVLTWLWTAIYAGLAPVAVYIWILQRRRAPDAATERDARLAPLRALSWVLGAALAVLGVALFVAPDRLLEEWPWPITALIARVFAGWYLLAALTLLYSAFAVRRAWELPIPYATVGSWCLLALSLPLLYAESINEDGTGFWLWLALHAAVAALAVWAVVRSAGILRAERMHLQRVA